MEVLPICFVMALESEGMCLEEINAARRKAGFSNFTQPASGSDAALPSEDNVELWYPVCLAATPVSF